MEKEVNSGGEEAIEGVGGSLQKDKDNAVHLLEEERAEQVKVLEDSSCTVRKAKRS